MYNRSIDIRFVTAAVLTAAAALPIPAWSDIVRGCTARLEVTSAPYVGKADRPDRSKERTYPIDQFEGRGSCRNRIRANDCRRRARDSIFRCARDLWNSRWDRDFPDSCYGRGSNGVHHLGPFPPNRDGNVEDLKFAMERMACCSLHPRYDHLDITLKVRSWGQKRCAGEETLYVGYDADCKRLRSLGWCE